MKKSFVEIYGLLVCLCAAVAITVALGNLMYDLVRITQPELTIPVYRHSDCIVHDKTPDVPKKQETCEKAIKEQIREGKQNFIWEFITLFLSSIAYLIHWKIAKKARKENNN